MARPAFRPGNLPADTTSFVGRRRELAGLKRRLTEARMVSLVGPGGVGKTRLAIRVAADIARAFRAGAWLVELADVRDPALVAGAVLAALDLRDVSTGDPLSVLLTYLADRQLLLVLDNCEHLLGAAARLAGELLAAAPGVRVLATSREPLSAPGEHVVPVPPLELPPGSGEEALARLRQNEAVTLFVERAAAACGSFELTATNQAAVVGLCRRLDGLPLAIELAAVRTRVLTVEQIFERLNDRFGLLTGGARAALPRHQTLRTAIDWSHDLLTGEERALLRRLAVFAGRFTLDDVGGVCAGAGAAGTATLDLLASLVDKSLVVKEDAGGVAVYRLHETMREFAALKLRAANEEELFERRCVEFYVAACLQTVGWSRYHLVEWLAWIDLEADNIRFVLRRCVTRGDVAAGIELAVAAGWFWITRATTEGVRWLDELLSAGGGNPPTTAWAYFMRGFLAALQSDHGTARVKLERAVDLGRETEQPTLVLQALTLVSIAGMMASDRAGAARALDEAQALGATLDDYQCAISLLQARAMNALFAGDLDMVATAASEGARIGREAGDLYGLEMMLLNLASASVLSGDFDLARLRLAEGLRIAGQIDDRVAQYALLDSFGYVAAQTGHARLAAQLLGAAETVRTSAGASVIAILGPLLEAAEEKAGGALGRSRYDAEYAAGKALSREAAIGLALGESPPREPSRVEAPAAGPLAKREAEVAQLLAEGLSNKQIGARLFISEHTVDSHVRSILNKLGFNSRAQIAAWVAADTRH